MAPKLFSVLFLALVAQAYSVTLITLEDEVVNYISNPIIGRGISIPMSFLDTLLSCHVIFPNGITYEVYPNSNLPSSGTIFFKDAVDTRMFQSCGIAFRGIGLEDAGTYELMSMVEYRSDGSQSLTRKKFHVNVVISEVEFPTK